MLQNYHLVIEISPKKVYFSDIWSSKYRSGLIEENSCICHAQVSKLGQKYQWRFSTWKKLIIHRKFEFALEIMFFGGFVNKIAPWRLTLNAKNYQTTWLLNEYAMDGFNQTDVLWEKNWRKTLLKNQVTAGQDISRRKGFIFSRKIVSVQKGFMELKMVNVNRRVLMINRKRVFLTRKSFLSDVSAPQKHLKRLFSKLGTCYETLDSKKNMSM